MPVVDVTPKIFNLFLFISIDIEYKRNSLFMCILLQTCIDNNINIIINLDIKLANDLILL